MADNSLEEEAVDVSVDDNVISDQVTTEIPMSVVHAGENTSIQINEMESVQEESELTKDESVNETNKEAFEHDILVNDLHCPHSESTVSELDQVDSDHERDACSNDVFCGDLDISEKSETEAELLPLRTSLRETHNNQVENDNIQIQQDRHGRRCTSVPPRVRFIVPNADCDNQNVSTNTQSSSSPQTKNILQRRSAR
ncbi:hypothetical protein ROZALSC1DRAFT_26083, partial [Rozella allomycis CSF55]